MVRTVAHAPQFIFRLTRLLELVCAGVQGKGFGASSIGQEVKLLLQALGRTPQLAIDIGGNTGEYTAELRRKSSRLEIHTFEPSSINIQKLRVRFGSDANIHLVPAAVSNTSGTATLFSNAPGSGLASLAKRNLHHLGVEFDVKEAVATLRFEEYWRKRLSERTLDIVKLDIEGHELAALEGFGEAIAATRALQFEFGGADIDTRTYFRDFWYFFKDAGFQIFRITPIGLEQMSRYRESDERFLTTNFIATNAREI
jgi:FkbM family methyltransferase